MKQLAFVDTLLARFGLEGDKDTPSYAAADLRSTTRGDTVNYHPFMHMVGVAMLLAGTPRLDIANSLIAVSLLAKPNPIPGDACIPRSINKSTNPYKAMGT